MKKHPLARAITLSLALTATTSVSVSAETSSSQQNLETITVVSSRSGVPLKELATSVEIITSEDIAALGNLSLADILRSATSVGVSNSGGAGKNTTLRIRGEEGYRSKLYLDGVELSDPSAPQVSPIFDDLLATQIQQIEILRGAQGLAYGADAGGVISISSDAKSEGLSASVNAQAGRYDSRLLNADIAFGNQHGGVYLAATDFSTDGFNATTSDESGERDGYDNTTLHFNGHFNINQNASVKLVIRDVDGENQYDGCFDNATFAATDNCETDSNNQTVRLSGKYSTENQSHELGLAKTEVERRFFSNGEFGFANEGQIEKADYVGSFESETLRVVFGADIEKQQIENGGSRYQRAAFTELQSEISDAFFVNAGLRYDDNETFGTHTSIRLGAAYLMELADQGAIKFKSTYGTGFRAPSLFEQSYNDGPFAFGDAASLQLKEESSEGFDLGLEYYAANGLIAEVVAFNQSIEDEIVFDNVSFQGYLQGSGTSKSKGLESSIEYPISSQYSLWGNYTYNDTETSDGENRLRRPRHTANLGLTVSFAEDKLKINAHLRSVKDAFDIGGTPLDDYTITNLTVSYDVLENLTLHARGENLFDKDYEEVIGFNTAGSAFYLGITATL